MEDLKPTLQVLQKIAQKHNKTPAAVALNWNIIKGAILLLASGIRSKLSRPSKLWARSWMI
jgi:diketogulonate reductase-like aldo/keto reductase